MSDTLGPLPEPEAWQVYWRGDNDSTSWVQWHDSSDPMPDEWDDEQPDEVTPHYTADQMRTYAAAEVAKERDRCAKLWRLLDDIDTLDDACRFDSEGFRQRVRAIQRSRFAIMTGEEYDAAIRGLSK